MAHIDADALLPNDRVQQAAIDGDVTQLSRGGSNRYASEGDTFELGGTTFEVTSVEERTLGDLTDADAAGETVLHEGPATVRANGWVELPSGRLLSPSAVHHVDRDP